MKKIDIFNWIGNIAIESNLKSGDKIQIVMNEVELCVAEMLITESKDIEFKIKKSNQ